MASINLSGILVDSLGEIDVGAIITWTHLTTTGQTIATTKVDLVIPPDGSYDIDVEFGEIRIDYTTRTGRRFIKIVIVNGDTTATTIPQLLDAAVPNTVPSRIAIRQDFHTRVDLQAAAASIPDGLHNVWGDINPGRVGAYDNLSGVITLLGDENFDEPTKLSIRQLNEEQNVLSQSSIKFSPIKDPNTTLVNGAQFWDGNTTVGATASSGGIFIGAGVVGNSSSLRARLSIDPAQLSLMGSTRRGRFVITLQTSDDWIAENTVANGDTSLLIQIDRNFSASFVAPIEGRIVGINTNTVSVEFDYDFVGDETTVRVIMQWQAFTEASIADNHAFITSAEWFANDARGVNDVLDQSLASISFTAGDLESVIMPELSSLNGAVNNSRNDGIDIPIGSTGASSQARYELPMFGTPSGTRILITYLFETSVNIDFQTPISKTAFARINDGTVVTTGFVTTLTKNTATTWTGTAEYTLDGTERGIQFYILYDAAPTVRTSIATLKIVGVSYSIISTTAAESPLEQVLEYRESVEENRDHRLSFRAFNNVEADGTGDFTSVVDGVNAIGGGITFNETNAAIIGAGNYLNEVTELIDIDPQYFTDIRSPTRESETVIDGRQAALTPNQDLIETVFIKHSGTYKGFTALAENSRYPFHLESGNSNDRATQNFEDVTGIHFGADIWASPSAYGIGHHDGQKQIFKRVTGLAYNGGAFGFHNSKDWIYGMELLVEDSQFWSGKADGAVLSCSSLGAGLMSTATFRNCSINGTLVVNNNGWISTKLVNQPANRWEYKLIFDNCSPFDWYAPNDNAAAFILQSLSAANSEIVLGGDAVPVLFGKRADIRKGDIGLPAKAFSYHAITTDGTDPGVELEARLGDRTTLPTLQLDMTFDGGSLIFITLDENYTGLTNAAVIALLQTKLDTAQGGATGRAFAENFGEWRNNAPVFQPSREGMAANSDVTAILKGHAVAWDGNDVVLMTNAMPVSRFAGISMKDTIIGDPVRFHRSGWINHVMLRSPVGAAVLYDTWEVGVTAGELVIGTTNPILRTRSLQSYGDTHEFIGKET